MVFDIDAYLRGFDEWRKDPLCSKVKNLVPEDHISSQDLQKIVDSRIGMDVNSGYFISDLVNLRCDSDVIAIETTHPIGALGYKNDGKTWIIRGDVSDNLGEDMKKGEIIVEGDAGKFVGLGMKKGKIMINGNASTHTGFKHKNGEIIICGNAGNFLGCDMEGGKILVKGNAGNNACYGMKGGSVYVYGKAGISDDVSGGSIHTGLAGFVFYNLSHLLDS